MHVDLPSKYYFINKFDTNNIDKLDKNTGIILRNYTAKIDLKSILDLKKFCKKKGYKFFLSNNVKLALNLNLDGAYIPSFNRDTKHLSFSMKKQFLMLGSAHNNKEIKLKERQLVKIIFLSSVFKKNKNFLGINRFKNLSGLTKKRIIVLGGINKKNIKLLNLLNKSSFAGISYFE